jgi:EF-hand domain pair
MPPTKEELKIKEREEEIKKLKEMEEAAKKQREETEQVRKEVFEYRRAIDEMQRRIRRSGENVRNWFNLFDSDKDGNLEPEDFKRLLKHAGVVVRDQDLARVFELIDLQQLGHINYNDFLNVVEKNVTLPIEKIVRKRRIDRGEAYVEGASSFDAGLHPEEEERLRNYKSHYGEFSSTQAPANKFLGSIDGMSHIMKRSEDGDG